MADRPRSAPPRHAVVQALALGLGQQLGVAHLVHAAVGRQDRGADADRARPRAAADLVDPHDDLAPVVPQGALDPQAGDGTAGDLHGNSSTRGAPVSTEPIRHQPSWASASPTAGGTEASKPPDVWGSTTRASSGSGAVLTNASAR